jgi:PadR family transcriptional regulator PadR
MPSARPSGQAFSGADVELPLAPLKGVEHTYGATTYLLTSASHATMLDPELKKGTTPLLILSLLEVEPRHGYELSKLIAAQSRGVVRIHAASLYPLLYRLEKKGWIKGLWVEKPGQRRRRFYQLTAEGKRQLEAQRKSWQQFVQAVSAVAGVKNA